MTLLNLMLAARAAIGLVLIVAGLRKLAPGGRRRLEKAIKSYGILPARSQTAIALTLPWLELLLGVLLGLGVLVIATALCVSLMLAAFAAAVGWQVKQGRSFSCGCGTGASISWSLVAADGLMSVAAAAVAVYPREAMGIWVGPGWIHAIQGKFANSIPVPMIVLVVAAGWRLVRVGVTLRSGSTTRSALVVAN